jgi:hypothetical protein
MSPSDPSPKGLRSYSVILAAEIGEPAAQMFHRIWYFCTRTDSGKVVDGRRWIRNSFPQWRENHFPHWGLNTVKRACQILMDRELIHKGDHNQARQDRTLWYAVNFDHHLLIEAGYIDHRPSAQNGLMHRPKMGRCKDPKWVDAKAQNGLMHRPKMGLSYKHRDNKEDISKRQSSSPGREEDEIINKQISKMKEQARSKGEGCGNADGESADSGPEESVSPAENEGEIILPHDPSDDLLKKVYGESPPPAIDFLAADYRTVDLNPYLRPFKNQQELSKFFSREQIRALNTPGPAALELKYADFVNRILEDHFVGEVHGGIRVMAMRAVRAGFLNRCGFKAFCARDFPEGYNESRPFWARPENIVWEQW